MPFKIVATECSGCTACEVECPNDAIREKVPVFVINPAKSTECVGFFDDSQCVEVCPAPGAIILDTERPPVRAAA